MWDIIHIIQLAVSGVALQLKTIVSWEVDTSSKPNTGGWRIYFEKTEWYIGLGSMFTQFGIGCSHL